LERYAIPNSKSIELEFYVIAIDGC
jgi:hypothetical protein